MRGVLEEKSFNFAIRVVKLNRYLTEIKHEYVISKQLLRSGTSIGANISEVQFAQSKSDFGTKMHISLKEANETRYWVRLLTATDYQTKDESESLISDCNELISLLSSTCKTVLPRTHEE